MQTLKNEENNVCIKYFIKFNARFQANIKKRIN